MNMPYLPVFTAKSPLHSGQQTSSNILTTWTSEDGERGRIKSQLGYAVHPKKEPDLLLFMVSSLPHLGHNSCVLGLENGLS